MQYRVDVWVSAQYKIKVPFENVNVGNWKTAWYPPIFPIAVITVKIYRSVMAAVPGETFFPPISITEKLSTVFLKTVE